VFARATIVTKVDKGNPRGGTGGAHIRPFRRAKPRPALGLPTNEAGKSNIDRFRSSNIANNEAAARPLFTTRSLTKNDVARNALSGGWRRATATASGTNQAAHDAPVIRPGGGRRPERTQQWQSMT
jgi:hypothetical protein